MAQPEAAPSFTWTELSQGGYRRDEATDPATGEHVLTIADDMGIGRIEEIGLTVSESTTRTFRIHPNAPCSALETVMTCRFSRDTWSAETKIRGVVSGDGSDITVVHQLEAREGEKKVYARDWHESLHLR